MTAAPTGGALPPGRSGPLVLLDRDGTLIEHVPYLRDPAGVRVLDGVGGALSRLCAAGAALRVVTNQSGVGRGTMAWSDVAAVNRRLELLLREDHGVVIDGFHVCPHRPEDGCSCRKPAPGLLEAAIRAAGPRRVEPVMVGDAASDVGAGLAAGVRVLHVRTGPVPEPGLPPGVPSFRSLSEAADAVLDT